MSCLQYEAEAAALEEQKSEAEASLAEKLVKAEEYVRNQSRAQGKEWDGRRNTSNYPGEVLLNKVRRWYSIFLLSLVYLTEDVYLCSRDVLEACYIFFVPFPYRRSNTVPTCSKARGSRSFLEKMYLLCSYLLISLLDVAFSYLVSSFFLMFS